MMPANGRHHRSRQALARMGETRSQAREANAQSARYPRILVEPNPWTDQGIRGSVHQPMAVPPRILIIEDDDLQHEIYEEALRDYELIRVTTGTEALKSIARSLPNLILLDHILAEGELGLDYLAELKEALPYVPIILVSGALEVHQQMEALQGPRRAHYCLTKPVDVHDLRRLVEVALRECGETEVVRQFEALERSKRIDVHELLSRSTDRLSRQGQIRQLLEKQGSRPNISALSRQFRVARRTIIRDLQELIRREELPPDVYPKWESPSDDEADEEP
jgi:CheY-like chemotaxis protein